MSRRIKYLLLLISILVLIFLSVLYFTSSNSNHVIITYEDVMPPIEEVTSTTKRYIGNRYNLDLISDNEFLYYNDAKIEGADLQSVSVFAKNILKDKEGVFIIDTNDHFQKIKGLRPDNLRWVINGRLSLLANDTQVYFSDNTYEGGYITDMVINPTKLEVVSDIDDGVTLLFDGYKMYTFTFEGIAVLPVISPVILQGSHYILGSNGVYYGTDLVERADPASFVLINEKHYEYYTPFAFENRKAYAKDKQNIYFKNKVLDGADLDTFKILNARYYDEYASDAVYVYLNGELIKGADSETFVPLSVQPYEGCRLSMYSKDKNNVYYMTEKVEGADPNTFTPLIEGYGKDLYHSYYKGIMIDKDPKDLYIECDYG